ncbi:hypothetical protein HDV00_010684 [Rhizophlyctis rosea]|nr:hypothetical protein HDV00_010684 [Rhizophlyctis rosea]
MNIEDYELGPPIGYGSSAIVYLAKYKPFKKTVSIKMIDLDLFERNQIDELRVRVEKIVERREIQIMSLSKHPHLLPVHGSFVYGSKLYIVTPFLYAGSCLDIMKTAFPDGFDEGSIATILKQALEGLSYLHKNGLIHRDVKAGNLLMDEDGTVQLGDFGVSSSLMDTGERKGLRKTFVGTPCWMAPEVMEQSGYDYKADIWSFGITALELATGHAPFAKYPPLKVLMLTLQNDPPTLDRDSTKHKYSRSFKEMIDMCLVKDPSKRPTAEKLLSHSFFKQSVKRKQHLVQFILFNLPPITQRQHNKRQQGVRQEQHGEGISWDFSSAGEESSLEMTRSPVASSQDSISSQGSTSSRAVSFAASVSIVPDRTAEATPIPVAAPAPVKKSRFIVDSPGSQSPIGGASSPGLEGPLSQGGDGGVGSTSSTSSSGMGEVRKGRFSLNQHVSASNVLEGSGKAVERGSPLEGELPRSSSDGGVGSGSALSLERKAGRFAVQSVSQQPPSNTPTPVEGRPPSRFTISSEPNTPVSATGSLSDKRGRFEIAGTESLSERLENLLRQNEQQRQVLNDLVAAMNRTGISPASLGVVVPAGVFLPTSTAPSSTPGLTTEPPPTTNGIGVAPSATAIVGVGEPAEGGDVRAENERLKGEVMRLKREIDVLKAGGREDGRGRPEAGLAGAAAAIAHHESLEG